MAFFLEVQASSGGGPVSREASIDGFLRAFERASEANDADRKAELYAPEVDRYFLRSHVTREFVNRDLLDWLSRGRLITHFHLTLLSQQEEGDARILLVRKEASWIDGGRNRVLTTRSQIIVKRAGAGWQILSERDYKPVSGN